MRKVIRRAYSKEDLLEIISKANEVAKELNVPLSISFFNSFTIENFDTMIIGSVLNVFSDTGKRNGWSNALKLLGIETYPKYTKESVLEHVYQAYLSNGNKQPSEQNIADTGVSLSTVYKYFKRTSNAVKAMYEAKGIKQEYKMPRNVAAIKKRDAVGESLRHLPIGMDEAPVNEQGVVMLFGKIHWAIGFPSIIKAQQEFPDCYANSILHDQYHRAKIEFKFKSSLFRRSKRSVEEWERMVDYLICWEHDSEKFEEITNGIEVIALKDELDKPNVIEKLYKIYSDQEFLFKLKNPPRIA